ncbi:MAG TPA: hypothetical protein VGL81_33185 [Polyangiaceae bacterium]|jgi:hypothetical protein
MRKHLLLVLSLGAATAACTSLLGDFTVKASAGDGGSSSGGEGGGTDTCKAVTSDVSVYLGQKATLDGSGSTTTSSDSLTYSWSVGAVPPGSGVATNTLSGGSTAQASFTPDLPGDYTLVLTVSAGDCPPPSTPATVHALLPQVLFAQGSIAGGAQASYVVADLDGGPPHPVMCPDTVVTSVPNEIATFAAYAGRAYDFWEAPAGQPSNYAAFTVDFLGGNYTTHLYAGTTASGCDASLPHDLGTNGFGPSPFGTQPRFNKSGTRFAVYDSQFNILTFAPDGSSQHTVTQYGTGQSGVAQLDPLGRGPAYNEPPRVAWNSSGTELAWARSNQTTGGWEVVTAPDQPNATPTLYMSCAGVTPREITLLDDGSIIAGYRASTTSGENIFQLTADNQQKCQVEHQYTSVSDASTAIAADFDVSPDQKTLAYLQLDPSVQDASLWNLSPSGQYPGGYVYIVPINAGSPPTQVSTQPALFGPRWIGGGTRLVFTGLDGTSDSGPPKTSVVVISPDGGGHQVVAQGDGVNTFVSTSGSSACDVAAGRVGPFGAALVSLAACAQILRRRRRR